MRTTPVSSATPTEFPHAAQLVRVLRYTGDLDGQRHSQEVAYCVTSLTPDQATAEDLPTLRTGTAPQARRSPPPTWPWCANPVGQV